MEQEKILSTQQLYQGRALNLRVDRVEKPSGRETTREVVEHPDCVAIIALDANNNVFLVRQYRHAIGKEILEIPAGGINPGESPAEAVRRELQEETGYFPKKVEIIGGFYSAPGYCTEYLYLCLATELMPSRLFAEDTEGIKIVRVPLAKAGELIASGEVCDAKSIAGLLRAKQLAL